jgi:hypothetical protein
MFGVHSEKGGDGYQKISRLRDQFSHVPVQGFRQGSVFARQYDW